MSFWVFGSSAMRATMWVWSWDEIGQGSWRREGWCPQRPHSHDCGHENGQNGSVVMRLASWRWVVGMAELFWGLCPFFCFNYESSHEMRLASWRGEGWCPQRPLAAPPSESVISCVCIEVLLSAVRFVRMVNQSSAFFEWFRAYSKLHCVVGTVLSALWSYILTATNWR